MENAFLEAREVNRLLTTPEGRKELLAKTPTGTENLTEAAKKVAEQEQLKGIDNSSRLLPEENKNAPKIQKPNGIPNNWIEKPTRKGGGGVTRTQRTPMIS